MSIVCICSSSTCGNKTLDLQISVVFSFYPFKPRKVPSHLKTKSLALADHEDQDDFTEPSIAL